MRPDMSASLGMRPDMSASLGMRPDMSASLGMRPDMSVSLGMRLNMSASLGMRLNMSESLGMYDTIKITWMSNYAFPSHFCLTTYSSGDNYVHVRTVDIRYFSLRPPRAWVQGWATPLYISKDSKH